MGSCFQYHVTMLISGEQEEAIRFMFKEKKWPCLLSVLSKETVTDIVQSGFTDVFPFPAESEEPGGVGSFREIKSEVVNIETEDSLTKEYQATSVKREAPRSSDEEDDDLYDDSTDENDESDEDQNESASSTNMPSETTTRKRSSKAKKLKMDKGARVYKNMQRRVKCPLCDVELASKSILKRHCLRRHPDEWFEFKCADCPSMFKTQQVNNKIQHPGCFISGFKKECDHVIAVCQNDQTVDQAQGFKRFRPAAGTSAEPELSESENYVCEVTTSNSTDRPVNTSCEVRSKFTNMPVNTSCEVRSESTNKPVSTSCEAGSKSTNIPVNTSCEERSESTNKPVSTSSEVKSKSTNRLSNKGNEGRSKSMHWTVNLGCEVATYKSTNWAVNTLNEWITEMRYDADGFEEWPADKLDSMLEEFYSSLRTKKGEEYSGSSLAGIRAGLNRYLTQPPHNRSLCLMRDKEFVKSNLIIYKLKSVQKDDVEHREPISDEDLIKLYESGAFSLEKPRTLQNKVQFETMMNFDIHGKEGLRSLKKTDFKLETDPNGCLFISLNESNKIHTSAGRDVNKKQCMYEQPGDKHCPVTSFMKYLSKLNPACDALFQRPKVVDIEDSIWYGEMPVGLNTLAKLMSRLSERAELSVRYTNQCIRATFFKILQRVKVSGLGVYAITRQNNAYGVRAHEQSTEITQMPVHPVCLAPDSTKRNSNVEEDVKNSALTEPGISVAGLKLNTATVATSQ